MVSRTPQPSLKIIQPPDGVWHRRQSAEAIIEGAWRRRLGDLILQEPLIETRPSLAALRQVPAGRPPGAVFVGVGLGTPSRMSEVVPLDILGILLPAERVRYAINAGRLVVLVADAHTRTNGFKHCQVEEQALRVVHTLERIRGALGLKRMQIVRASSFHDTVEYRRILDQVKCRGADEDHPYFGLEVADVQYMNRLHGGIVKVGWTIGRSGIALAGNDEAAFDRRFLRWVGRHIGFVYCRAGRVFDDRRPKASPYVTLNGERRLCLHPEERVKTKVELARQHASEQTARGVKNHLKKIARCYCAVVEPLRGAWDQRMQAILSRIFFG
jgi:hypothetical protein